MNGKFWNPVMGKCSICGRIRQIDAYNVVTKENFCEECSKKRDKNG